MPEHQMRSTPLADVVTASGEMPIFKVGDAVKISTRLPIGHYRVPLYVRGKTARVEVVIEPVAVDNEEEGFGRNAGARLHYYRLAIPLSELWLGYTGPPHDSLRIEVFETWLELL